MTFAPVNALSLNELVEALRPLAPVDVALPADLQTAMAFVVLYRMGWSGALVSRTTLATPLLPQRIIHKCLFLDGVSLNARGETFDELWVDRVPPQPGVVRLENTMSMVVRPGNLVVEVADAEENKELHDATRAAIEGALLRHALVAPENATMDLTASRRL